MKKKKQSYSVYFAGEFFSFKHLIGNAYLAEAIYEKSHGKYLCMLPQDLEPRGRTLRAVRDHNLRTLLSCDLALFNYDGTELDSGIGVEFMLAKCADIPAVLLRSDVRHGNKGADPWNLMSSFFPRTISVLTPSLSGYKTIMKRRHRRLDEILRLAGQHGSADAQRLCEQIAILCVRAFERLLGVEPVMPKYLREEVYHWLARMPGLRGKEKMLRKELERVLEQKVEKGLL